MMVLVIVMIVILPYRDGAAVLGDGATEVLELNGGMSDMETLGEHAIQPPQHAIALRRRNIGNPDVATQGVRVRSEAPDVQVVNIEHALDVLHGGGHISQTDAAGKPFQEDVQRLPDNIPGCPDDHPSNGNG